jgi:hypothetical protein
MAGSGTDAGAAVGEVRHQVEQVSRRLSDLEKVKLPALSRKVSELDGKWAADKQGQQEAGRQTRQARQLIADLDAVLGAALEVRPLAFADLKTSQPLAAPDRLSYQPQKKFTLWLPGGAERFERDAGAAELRYQRDYGTHALKVQQAAKQDAYVQQQEAAFAAGDRVAVEWFAAEVLRHSQ